MLLQATATRFSLLVVQLAPDVKMSGDQQLYMSFKGAVNGRAQSGK